MGENMKEINQIIIKDDEIIYQSAPIGKKHDNNKPKYSLLPSQIWQVIDVLEFGAKKYSRTEIDLQKFQELTGGILWQKYKNVLSAGKPSVLLQEGFVPHVTGMIPNTMRIVQSAENLDILHQKTVCADLAMSEKELEIVLKSSKENMSIRNGIGHSLSLDCEKRKESRQEDKTQNILQKLKEMDFYGVWQNMDCLNKNILCCWSVGVQSAEARSGHTLTMTIKLEDLEICFVANATKLLDCCKMIQKLLKVYFNISINTSQIEIFKSGIDNWQQVDNAKERYFNACHRHLQAWWSGERLDSESGLPHLAHAVCCLLFLMWGDDELA